MNYPVSSIAAFFLMLDPAEYVDVEFLSKAARYHMVLGMLILGVGATFVGVVIGHVNSYYRVWIMQGINQNLRLRLMSQLQGLSLKFHSESKTGDSIYRLFQDSAMVTSILQTLLVEPFLAMVRFFMGVAIVAAARAGGVLL